MPCIGRRQRRLVWGMAHRTARLMAQPTRRHRPYSTVPWIRTGGPSQVASNPCFSLFLWCRNCRLGWGYARGVAHRLSATCPKCPEEWAVRVLFAAGQATPRRWRMSLMFAPHLPCRNQNRHCMQMEQRHCRRLNASGQHDVNSSA